MTGMTPGRAAYEAYCAAYPYDCVPWDDLSSDVETAMEAAAEAARSFGRPAGDDPVERLLALPLDETDTGAANARAYHPGYRQLEPAERLAATVASAQLARGENPPVNTTAALLLTIKRLTGEGQEQAAREGR